MPDQISRDYMIEYLQNLKSNFEDLINTINNTSDRIADNEAVDNEAFSFRFQMMNISIHEMLDFFVINEEEVNNAG